MVFNEQFEVERNAYLGATDLELGGGSTLLDLDVLSIFAVEEKRQVQMIRKGEQTLPTEEQSTYR